MKRKGYFTATVFKMLAAVCLAFPSLWANAQRAVVPSKDTVVLEGFINVDKALTPDKIYLVKYNVKVAKSATLSIRPGTKIIFDPGTSVVVEGGLAVNGAAGNFIEIGSSNPNSPGTGFLIRGNQGKNIDINYTVFRALTIPLRFESEWYRRSVRIEKNVFTELFTGESNILITSPLVEFQPGVASVVDFSFSQNAFYNNWGSIFIENFEDNFMKLKFNENVITNNVVYGIDIGIPSNTPVFGLFDNMKSENKVEMRGNSIFGNYQINSSTDTVIREISVGIQGSGEEFSIPNNFFRSKSIDYIASTFDHFYQNNKLPLLRAEPILTEPKEIAPPHIWKVKLNGNEISNYDDIPDDIDPRNVSFEVYFNKPVSAFGNSQLEKVSYDTIASAILKNPVPITQMKWSPDKRVFSFVVSNASFLKDALSYIIITNFKDAEGFITPNFPIGQGEVINKFKSVVTTGRFRSADLISDRGMVKVDVDGKAFLPDEKSVKALATLTDFGGISNLGPYRSLTKTWEVGLMAGVSNYFGTFSYKLADRDEYNFSIGVFGQYNLDKWFSFRAMFWYGKISGDYANERDPDRQMRLNNFKNNIVEGSITAHWHLLKYGSSRSEKFTPTIFGGIAIFRNNPMSKIYLYENKQDIAFGDIKGEPVYLTYKDGQFLFDGSGKPVWVPLRPIGTEGQTVGGTDPEAFGNSQYLDFYNNREAPKQYRKVQVGFPFGVSLDYIIYNKWVLSAELGVRVTTTRYLDDIGGYYWDRGREWILQNDGRRDIVLDPITLLPLNAHQSIIDANPEIWGKAGRDKIRLDNQITFTDPNTGITTTYNTAALLANPSLVNVDEGIANPDPNIPNPNQGNNDAYTFPDGKRANPKSRDHYAFVGLKISKVIAKRDKKKSKSKNTGYTQSSIVDSDNDGLSDDIEKMIGTNPRNYDTDGDGLSDGEEVDALKTDPLKKDTDGDGWDDGKEVRETGTDPLLADTDGDGVIDSQDKCPLESGPASNRGCPE